MYTKTTFTTLAVALLSQAAAQQSAPEISGNPVGVTYKAALSGKPFFADAAIDGDIKGSISASAPADGNGVQFKVNFDNLPKEGGPFIYHIHVEPAVDGNCTSTLGHLDPYERQDKPACDSSAPETCQVGDLSGKHGKISESPFSAEYIDHFTSTQKDSNAFFGNRSFVIHYANGTRLACANFAKIDTPAPSTNSTNCNGTAPAMPSNTGSHGGNPLPTKPTSGGNPVQTTAVPPVVTQLPGAASTTGLTTSLLAGMVALMAFAL